MFRNKKLAFFVVLVMVASLVLAACAPEPEVVVQTVEVEKVVEKVVTQQVEVTKIIEKEGKEVTIIETQVVEVQVTAAPEEPTAVPAAEPQTVRYGTFEDMTTTNYWAYLDPDSSVWNGYVLGNMHGALSNIVYPGIAYIPWLAEELVQPAVQEGDFWVAEVKIKDDVTWSDGEALTVDDLIFAWETSDEFGLGGNWLGYTYSDYVDRMEAVDDYTVKVYFSQEPGLSVWDHGVALHPFMPEHFWADTVEECRASEDPATCLYAADGGGEPSIGAFMFTKWEPGAFAEIAANPNYYWKDAVYTFYADGSFGEVNEAKGYEFCVYGECSGDVSVEYVNGPHIPNVVYSIYGTQDAAVLAMANGEVDFLLNSLGLQRGLRDQVVGNAALDAFQNPSNGYRYLAFNMRKSPNDIPEFRQAIATLIDKEYITGNVLQNTAIPIYNQIPEANPFFYNSDVEKLGQGMTREERVNKAKELLKAGGFSWDTEPEWDPDDGAVKPGTTIKGPDGQELEEIELLAPSAGYDPMRATASIWIAQWASELGIPVKANPTGFNTIIPLVFEPSPETGEIEFDWYILGWSLGNPALPDFMDSFFSCDQDAKDGGSNTPGYCDEEFDAMADALLASKTLEEARDHIFKMDAKLSADSPYVVLFTAPILEFYAKDRLEYPFLETLSGLQFIQGAVDLVGTK